MTAAEKILIVDDDAKNLDVLEAILEDSGCTFVRAQSADEALLALMRHEFAAMILDIHMPGTGGIELANLVKQRRRTQDVPILFLTAHLVDDSDVLKGYSVGAVDYLSKPVNGNILKSKVAVFVDSYRKTRALAELNDQLQTQIAERRLAQDALERVNQELELRVAERTAALSVAHRGVRDNEERLRMAMDIAQLAAWEWDVQSGHVTWSTDPERLFGFPRGSLGPDRRIGPRLHPEDIRRVDAAIQEALESGTVYECEYRAVRPDSTIVWITERGRALTAEDGTVARVVGVSRDISADRRAEEERERLLASERNARDEAERQSRIKDEFLATLSHELRTPMNAILGWLSMLSEAEVVRDPTRAIAAIRRNAELQAKLIEDLLEMNKLTSGMVHLELGAVDINAALDGAIQSLQPAAIAKGITVNRAVGTGTPNVRADNRRLQQVLWNLIHNAVKFTPTGGVVDIAVTLNENAVEVAVADTGMGIVPEFLPHVFDRFRQADSSTTRRNTGLGIGLSIAKHLVELHGGSIDVQSAGPDRGATFTVLLPRTAPPPVPHGS
jgi:PAS domain S-box-containing protein